MDNNTLLVLAGNRKSFDKWTRTYGIKLKNTSVVMINSIDDTHDWEGNIYWTTLSDSKSFKDNEKIYNALEQNYKYVSSELIETKLKKVSINQQAVRFETS